MWLTWGGWTVCGMTFTQETAARAPCEMQSNKKSVCESEAMFSSIIKRILKGGAFKCRKKTRKEGELGTFLSTGLE